MNEKVYVDIVNYNVGDNRDVLGEAFVAFCRLSFSHFNMEDKKITKSEAGEVHFGVESLGGFESATKEDVEGVLKNLGDKKLWRCAVCNDLHIGINPPKECPTCHTKDAYVEIDVKEFRSVLEV